MKKGAAIAIAAAAVAAGIGIIFGVRHFRDRDASGADAENTAYVASVGSIMGTSGGLVNRFAGVVESQDTWSVQTSQDASVKEVLVTVGQEVTKGTPLFTYDTSKYEETLKQSQIDLERIKNEITSIQNTITELTKQKKSAKQSEQANYTIQLESQQLDLKQKKIDEQSKQLEIDKLNDNIKNATVTSQIDGVVKSIKSSSAGADSGVTYDSGSDSDSAFMTIMQTGDYRVKGTINEQNIGRLTDGMAVIVHSRVNEDETWKGTVSKVDMDNQSTTQNQYYSSDGSGQTSTSYPFYVTLSSSDGLMLGQHVYVEPDVGQDDPKSGLWLYDYYIDQTDAANPVVWVARDGVLAKQAVTLGQHDEDLGEYEITSGLAETDLIAMPDGTLSEGEKAEEMTDDIAAMDDTVSGGEWTDDTADGTISGGLAGYEDKAAMDGNAEENEEVIGGADNTAF